MFRQIKNKTLTLLNKKKQGYDENERVKQTESGMILIEKASKADEGKYYCVATNIAGSKNFTLEVIQSGLKLYIKKVYSILKMRFYAC